MAGHQPHHIHQQDNDHPNDEGAPTNVADCCMCNEPSHRHPCHSSSSSSGGCRTHQARTPPSNSAVVALDPASTSTPPIPFTRQHPHHALHWLGLGILTTTLLRKHHYHHITLFGRQRSTFYPFDAGQGQNFVVKGLLFFGLGYLVADVVNKRRALISARGKWQATHHNVKSECRKEKTPKGWKVILTAEAEMQGSELKDEEQVSPASKGNNNTDNDVEKSAAQPGIWVGSSADDHHHRHHHQHSPNQSSHQVRINVLVISSEC